MAARRITARKVADFRSAIGTDVLVDWSVDVRGTVTLLTARSAPQYRNQSLDGGRTFQRFSTRANQFTIRLYETDTWRSIRIPATKENFTDARVLNEREVLLIRSRTRDGDPANGAVFDGSGRETRRMALGDLVQQLLVTKSGYMWVGFGDEAWMRKVSRGGGIQLLDRRGRVVFNFNQHQDDACIDCYALTINNDDSALAYVYQEFDLWSLTGKRSTRLTTKLPDGVSCLAANSSFLLSDAGWWKPDQVIAINRRSGRRQKVIPLTQKGRVIRPDDYFGVCGIFYMLERSAIYAIDVPQARRKTS